MASPLDRVSNFATSEIYSPATWGVPGLALGASGQRKYGTQTMPTTYQPNQLPGYQPITQPSVSTIEDLTKKMNAINIAGQSAAQAARIPGGEALSEASSRNIGEQLAGEVPQDVINLLQQQGAERGVATGMPGSDNANSAYLRALGLTSLGQKEAGERNLTGAYARSPIAPLFDPSTQLLTPYQRNALALDQSKMATDYTLNQQKLEQDAELERMREQNALAIAALRSGGGGGYGADGGEMSPFSNPYNSVVGATGPFSDYNPSADYLEALYQNLPN